MSEATKAPNLTPVKAARPPFEPQEWAERLLALRASDHDQFMLRSTEADRATLEHYARWRDAGGEGEGEL